MPVRRPLHRTVATFCAVAIVLVAVSRAADNSIRVGEVPADRPQTVKVAAVQCSSILGDVEGNRKKLTALVSEAAGEGAKIIVLPEAAITGYLSQDLKTNWRTQGLAD